ncbi:Rieske 2Fe-2S domain-containing protein [Rhodopseudomonas sp. P2A-2r]|uniref:Rieske 2Fe-2S domain-containing protein n=1 Tax=Rhodopseudomonas sp. P2A-2r TaxID=2991972 RepID=UPI002234DCE8|nr:Rieske 2Fe-2S domain-containing protein [Rhodopseudomonas sp. P2A-2r]UZE50967.1 Rieske 2Fe-2S domain-containing protein [Rhodopseudomonas sp. P2A-2r]
MAFQRVCTLDDLWQGEMMNYTVGGIDVLLVHTDAGQLVATQAMCPHQEVELVQGELSGCILTCRAHLWRFNVVEGKGINPDHAELAIYPIKVEDDVVYVDVEGVEPKFAHS